MQKIDFRKEFGHLYFPSVKEVTEVDVPPMQFAAVDGKGDPTTGGEYADAIQALYAVSYTARFALKFARVAAYKVGPLETLWSTDTAGGFQPGRSRDDWRWTALIMQPAAVTALAFEEARARAGGKKPLAALPKVRLLPFDEGPSVQILHLGPYSSEGPTIDRLHAFLAAHGWRPRGRHHENYLRDPRRAAPERLKTVIRQPFAR